MIKQIKAKVRYRNYILQETTRKLNRKIFTKGNQIRKMKSTEKSCKVGEKV